MTFARQLFIKFVLNWQKGCKVNTVKPSKSGPKPDICQTLKMSDVNKSVDLSNSVQS